MADVGAADEQHEHAGAQKHEQRRPHVAHGHVRERHDVHSSASVGIGIRLLQAKGDRIEIPLGF
jgi:hypothetical protein